MDPVTLGVIAIATTAVSAGMSFVGGMQEASAQRQIAKSYEEQARLTQEAANVRARQMEQEAGQERARAQRAAAEERRQTDLVQSRAQAAAAAGGGGALDPTVLDVMGDIEEEGEYRALTALYEGEERGRGLEYGAELERSGGQGEAYALSSRAAATRGAAAATRWRTISTAAGDLGRIGAQGLTLYDRYGGGGPREQPRS